MTHDGGLRRRTATMTNEPREGIFAHWPNRITAMRFVGSLALFTLFAIGGETADPSRTMLLAAFWLFITIALTDFLDGYLARRGGQVTTFGRVADPFVDKVLVLGTMIFLAVMPWSQKWFPAWIIVVVLAREFLVTGIRGYVESLGKEFPADWFGKIKMGIQCFAIGTVLGINCFAWPEDAVHFLTALGHVLVWGTLLASIGSGCTYVLKTGRLLSSTET